MYKFKRMADER